MEFLKGIFSRVFSDSNFCLVSTIVFHVQNSIHEYTRVFLFPGFFVCIFKTRVGYISVNPPVEGTVNSMEQK